MPIAVFVITTIVLFAVVTTLCVALHHLSSKVDYLEDRIDRNRVDHDWDWKLLDKRLQTLDENVDTLDEYVDIVSERLNALDLHVDNLEKALTTAQFPEDTVVYYDGFGFIPEDGKENYYDFWQNRDLFMYGSGYITEELRDVFVSAPQPNDAGVVIQAVLPDDTYYAPVAKTDVTW